MCEVGVWASLASDRDIDAMVACGPPVVDEVLFIDGPRLIEG